MGFYPVCPGSPIYQIGSPIFDKVTIRLNENFYPGKTFVINAVNNLKENMYIQRIFLNRKSHKTSFIDHNDIVNGGVLTFEMDKNPVN